MSRASSSKPISMRVRLAYPNVDTFVSDYWPNVSSGGLFVQSKEPWPVGTRLSFELVLHDGTFLISGRARVSWIKEFDENRPGRPHGMGLRFLELDQDSQALVDRVVAHRDQMRGPSRTTGQSQTVELQALAEDLQVRKATRPPLEVHTEEQPMPQTTTDQRPSAPEGGAHHHPANTSELLERAERRLRGLTAGSRAGDAAVSAALSRIRVLYALRNPHAPGSTATESECQVLETADALGALEQALGLQPVASVSPLNTHAPKRRVIALRRPDLPPLDPQPTAADSAPGESAVDAAQQATSPGADSSDAPVAQGAFGETPGFGQREDTATVSTRLEWPATEERTHGGATETRLPDASPWAATAQDPSAARDAGADGFDLSESDDLHTPAPSQANLRSLTDMWPDPAGQDVHDEHAAQEPTVQASTRSIAEGEHTAQRLGLSAETSETHLELDDGDLEFVETGASRPGTQKPGARTQRSNAKSGHPVRAEAADPTPDESTPADDDPPDGGERRKKKQRSGIFRRLLGKED